jgi:hypothetical protein
MIGDRLRVLQLPLFFQVRGELVAPKVCAPIFIVMPEATARSKLS